MIKRPLENKNGITISQLKGFLIDFHEFDEYGDPTVVWIGHGNLSNEATEAYALDVRENEDGSKIWYDLILS